MSQQYKDDEYTFLITSQTLFSNKEIFNDVHSLQENRLTSQDKAILIN